MKAKTVAVAVLAGSVGYVLGARAGHGRFEQIRDRAGDLAHSPQVQDAVAGLAEDVKKGTGKLPDPVADVVGSVADSVNDSVQGTNKRARRRP